MSIQTIKADQFEIDKVPAADLWSRITAILAAIPGHFAHARQVEREAKRLYAMNDAALGKLGIDRESIRARLLESYKR